MFTGLVEETGEFVAVNGCGLTVTDNQDEGLTFDLLAETMQRTNLGSLAAGAPVNLERALSAHARLGGHFVQGHVDASSPILSLEKAGADHRLEIALPAEFGQYVAFKGSIAVDGVSLTVAEVRGASFVLWIIPHTLAVTNLRAARAGSCVNLEFDLLAKYVERLLAVR
jgi:riboflavin synthase